MQFACGKVNHVFADLHSQDLGGGARDMTLGARGVGGLHAGRAPRCLM